jgi:N-ethylmaleimide reductase
MRSAPAETLLSPVRLGNYDLANRIVMAPMTRGRVSPGYLPHPLAPTYYAQRASAGLIITEAAHVAPNGVGYTPSPGLYSAAQMEGWRSVTRAVHAKGGRIYAQLWHAGRVSHPSLQPAGSLPVAPSAVAPDAELLTANGLRFVTPRALNHAEISGLVEQFANAAQLAFAAGFDGVDIHAANGYLIDQFLRSGSNLRNDQYGGSVAKRARFLLEIVEAVSAVWGTQRVGVRLSPLKSHYGMRDSDPLGSSAFVVAELGRLNVGYVHIVEHGPGHPRASAAGKELLRIVRSLFSGCLVVDGGCDADSAGAALVSVSADLVALATPFIANPDLVERFAQNLPLSPANPATFYRGQECGYTDYQPYRLLSSGLPMALNSQDLAG